MIQTGKPQRTMKYAGPMNLQISGQSSIVSERRYLPLIHIFFFESFESSHGSVEFRDYYYRTLFVLRTVFIVHNYCKYCKFAVTLTTK